MKQNNLLSEQLKYTGKASTPTHLHLYSYGCEGVEASCYQNLQALQPLLKDNAVNWVQIHGLQDAETIRELCQHFGIDFLTTQDILNADHQTKIEIHDTYNLVIIKQLIPLDDDEYQPQQLCIVQGTNYVLTFAETDTDFFEDIHTALERNVLKIRSRQSDYLLSVILNSIMAGFMSVITQMEDSLEDMEEQFLSSDDDQLPGIKDIQHHRRNYRLIKRSIFPLKEQISKLLHDDNPLLHKVNRPFFNDVNDHLQFVLQTLEGCRDLLSSLIDLYLSNNDQRMNGIMKQLTIVSTVFIPLTFMAGIWGMNFQWMPELSWKYGYLMAWALMAVVAAAVYVYLKYKKWN